jgi:hypothetical protein
VAAPTPAISHATETELNEARSSGQKPLERLAERYPKDAKVWVELAKVALSAGNAGTSVDAVKNAYAADATVSKNAELSSIMWKTAQKRESSVAALRLLEGGFGERGIDILYDLTTTAGVRRDVQVAATSALYSMAAQNAASPSLRALLTLAHAKSCEDKAAALPLIERDADARALPLLSSLHSTVGCGKRKHGDCYECLRGGLQLENAISAVKKRSKQ